VALSWLAGMALAAAIQPTFNLEGISPWLVPFSWTSAAKIADT
jgi:hypothetical protein